MRAKTRPRFKIGDWVMVKATLCATRSSRRDGPLEVGADPHDAPRATGRLRTYRHLQRRECEPYPAQITGSGYRQEGEYHGWYGEDDPPYLEVSKQQQVWHTRRALMNGEVDSREADLSPCEPPPGKPVWLWTDHSFAQTERNRAIMREEIKTFKRDAKGRLLPLIARKAGEL